MKLKKIKCLASLLMLFVLCAITSCSDDLLSIHGKVQIPEETDLMQLERWGYKIPLTVESDSEWKVETTGDVCYVYPENGTGNATVNLCVVDNMSDERRNGELRIIFPKDESKNITMKLQQKSEADYGENADQLVVGNRIYAVGYGYDATEGYAENRSVRNPILRVDEMVDSLGLNGKKIVLGSVQAQLDKKTYTGSSIAELSNDLAVSANVSGGFGKFKGEISGSFDNSFFSSNYYEYALTYFDMTIQDATVEANIADIVADSLMLPSAYNAINGLTWKYSSDNPEGFKNLIRDYGTHLCVNARLGGRVRRSMAVNISKVDKSYDIDAFASASYDGVFVSSGTSVSESFSESYKSNQSACHTKTFILGGDSEKALQLTNNFSKENLEAWQLSVANGTGKTLVGFNKHSLIPLYELVDDQKFDARRKALEKYMNGKISNDYPSISMSYDCGTVTKFDVPTFEANGTLIKNISIDGNLVAQVCEEYIPVLNQSARVKVVYPVINNKTCFNMGCFLGNASHKPARVSWEGTKLTIKEHNDEPRGEMKTIYLKGASISSSTTSPEKDIVDKYIITDAVLEGNYGSNSDSYNYPLVKIFDQIWLRQDYQSQWRGDGYPVTKDNKLMFDYSGKHDYKTYYRMAVAMDPNYAPKGWRVANSDDYKSIASILEANSISSIGKAFCPGGRLGYDAEMKGWIETENPTKLQGREIQTEYWTADGYHIRLRTDGGFGVEDNLNDNYYMSIRLIKK